jgi:hypothetical protein
LLVEQPSLGGEEVRSLENIYGNRPLSPYASRSFQLRALIQKIVAGCWLLFEQPGKATSYKPQVAREQPGIAASYKPQAAREKPKKAASCEKTAGKSCKLQVSSCAKEQLKKASSCEPRVMRKQPEKAASYKPQAAREQPKKFRAESYEKTAGKSCKSQATSKTARFG